MGSLNQPRTRLKNQTEKLQVILKSRNKLKQGKTTNEKYYNNYNRKSVTTLSTTLPTTTPVDWPKQTNRLVLSTGDTKKHHYYKTLIQTCKFGTVHRG